MTPQTRISIARALALFCLLWVAANLTYRAYRVLACPFEAAGTAFNQSRGCTMETECQPCAWGVGE